MSTRAVYTFIETYKASGKMKASQDKYHVYRHHDGYPSGACQWIRAAQEYAWPLPRFEAAEFAAAFVRANKDHPGSVYFTKGPEHHGDLEYRYEVESVDGAEPVVRAFTVGGSADKIWEDKISNLLELGSVEA